MDALALANTLLVETLYSRILGTAREQGLGSLAAEKLAISLIFVPSDRRARDLDNLIGSMKASAASVAVMRAFTPALRLLRRPA